MDRQKIDAEKIKENSKALLDKFAKALEKVEKEGKEEDSYVDREEFEREEGEGNSSDNDFRKRILENAPNKDEDFIIAEKGKWS